MRRLLVVAVLSFAALAVPSAGAKEGVEATLLTPFPKDAAPGSTVRVEFRLAELATGRPFAAGGLFVRLIGTAGTQTVADADDQLGPGRFAADATVPDGGARGIRIGLRSISCAASCTSGAMYFRIVNNPFSDTWTPLRRPMHTPMIAYGARCPVARPATRVDFAAFGLARGIGPGPAYPVGWADGAIRFSWRRTDVDARMWGAAKVLWFVDPSYDGPVLVRGEQIDGPYRVRFERGRIPSAELRLAAGTRARPSLVRIRKPGCYAFQIDGLSFSRSIVFRALR